MKPQEYANHYLEVLDNYLKDVETGKRIVGNSERLAVQRFNQFKEKYIYKEQELILRLKFISLLRVQNKNEVTQPTLLPFQVFILAGTYSFFIDDKERLTRQVVISSAAKNGKTSFTIILSLLQVLLDGQVNALIAITSPTQKQSSALLQMCKNIIYASKAITPLFKINHSTIINKQKDSTNQIVIVTNETRKLQGYSLSAALQDEYFISRPEEAETKDIVQSKMQARENPLHFILGTFSDVENSTYENFYIPCKNILAGHATDDRMFIFFAEQDSKDEISKSEMYVKSNPALGVVKDLKDMVDAYEKTKTFPANLRTFQTDGLNYWTTRSEAEAFLEDDTVKSMMKSASTIPTGSTVVLALDLSSNRDLVGITMLHESRDVYTAKMISVMPNVQQNYKKGNVDLSRWFIDNVEGYTDNYFTVSTSSSGSTGCVIRDTKSVLNEDLIFDIVVKLSKQFNIKQIGLDSWNAKRLMSRLEDTGYNVLTVPQNVAAQNFPIKFMEQLIYNDQLKIEQNPCARWQASNIILFKDINGNVKFDKRKGLSIDNWSALVSCFYLFVADQTNRLSKNLDALNF